MDEQEEWWCEKVAWISVHEQVLGGKLRNLAKEIGCSQNEALGILVRLWLWGINNAGKDGCIEGADKDDVAEILNIGIDRRYSSRKVVDAMIETKWIDFDNGLYIHDWEEWQEQWYKALQAREKAAERKRRERAGKRDCTFEPAAKPHAAHLESESSFAKECEPVSTYLPEEQKGVPSAPAHTEAVMPGSSYPKDFEEFWSIYPRKVDKGNAYKKYKARINDGWKESELMEAASNYAEQVKRDRTEAKYIKHPKTFLSETTPFQDYRERIRQPPLPEQMRSIYLMTGGND